MSYRHPTLYAACGQSNSRPCTPNKRLTLAQVTHGALSSTVDSEGYGILNFLEDGTTGTGASIGLTGTAGSYALNVYANGTQFTIGGGGQSTPLDWLTVRNVSSSQTFAPNAAVLLEYPSSAKFSPSITSITVPAGVTFNYITLPINKTFVITTSLSIQWIVPGSPSTGSIGLVTGATSPPSLSSTYGSIHAFGANSLTSAFTAFVNPTFSTTILTSSSNFIIGVSITINGGASNTATLQSASLQIQELPNTTLALI